MKILGVTATRKGLTNPQIACASYLMLKINPELMHHGCAEGGDRQLDEMARVAGVKRLGFPSFDNQENWATRRDSGLAVYRSGRTGDLLSTAERNEVISRAEFFIGFPAGFEEEQRSGTWQTIRMRGRTKHPYLIAWPDGSYTRHEGKFVNPNGVKA